MRFVAVCVGAALLAVGLFVTWAALYLTGLDSSLPAAVKALVLLFVVAGIGTTVGGLLMAFRGRSESSWLLYGGTAVFHFGAYAIGGIAAEGL